MDIDFSLITAKTRNLKDDILAGLDISDRFRSLLDIDLMGADKVKLSTALMSAGQFCVMGSVTQNLIPANLALLFLIHASNILDDAADDELDDGVSIGEASSVATAMMALSRYSLDRLPDYGATEGQAKQVIQILQNVELVASYGQYDDNAAWEYPSLSLELAWSIAERKSARFMRAASMIGGILGQTDDFHLKALAEVGNRIGLAVQLRNDLFGAMPEQKGTDILKKKKTLPIVYALTTPRRAHPATDLVRNYYSSSCGANKNVEKELRQAIWDCGAIAFTNRQIGKILSGANSLVDSLKGDCDNTTYLSRIVRSFLY